MSARQPPQHPTASPYPASTHGFFPEVYAELHRIAQRLMDRERVDHTLSATALVSEAYLRLEQSDSPSQWNSRGHFFSAAAEAMRRVLIDAARAKASQKRFKQREWISLDSLDKVADHGPELLLDFDALLTKLAEQDSQAAEFVKLRVYGGLNVAESGRLLGLTRWSAYQVWDFAKAWFQVHNSDFETTK